jgi:hypothetical protein
MIAGGLHPLTLAAFNASSNAAWAQGKSSSRLAREHDEAAQAHKLAAESGDPRHKKMHEAHEKVHLEAAAKMREIAKMYADQEDPNAA